MCTLGNFTMLRIMATFLVRRKVSLCSIQKFLVSHIVNYVIY